MKKLVAILLVAVMALSFAACGKKNPIVGTWAMDFSEELAKLDEDTKAFMEEAGINFADYVFEFKFNADGTGHATIKMGEENESADFTYTAKDGKLTMTATVEGETQTQDFDYKLDGDVLTMTKDGESQVLKRK